MRVRAAVAGCMLQSFRVDASIFNQIRDVSDESRTLTQLRDTLLPKLISGELCIPDAAAFLKERGL